MTEGPLLTTERLELWRPVATDHAGLYAMMQSPVTRRFLGSWEPSEADLHARLLRNAGSWALYGYGTFMVRRRGEGRIVGNCGIFHSWRGLGADFDDLPEAGWILADDQVGQGVAGEAMRAAYAWFDATHGPRRTVCMIDPDNTPSIRMAEKLGFTPLRAAEFGGEKVGLYERV
ncbi:MAG: GNAT family N-acetyltransferase [Betaproteobacteria bacterium]|nr:GNAT family N-acetyltransferase [Betaproteobacteria bacterium]